MRNGDEKYTYVQHMLAEHRRLDAMLRAALGTFPVWEETDPGQWLPRFVTRLEQVRGELAHHFRDEEEGGCMEEAVARCPALNADWHEVEAQHPRLLRRLDELIARAQRTERPTAATAQTLWHDCWALVRDLRAHEALENRILQYGFNVCLEEFSAEATSVPLD